MAFRDRLALAWRRKIRRRLVALLGRKNRGDLTAAFRRLGLDAGATVCVHSSLSRLGHVVGGPETIVHALMDVVGDRGTIMMPSFPTAGSMVRRLESGQPFDVRRSPSVVGAVTESFRLMDGVERSLHPTNPVAAWGRGATALLAEHHRSPTPYGHETPYGRLARIEGASILMLETHVHSFLHHLQERVDFPNLFLDGLFRGEVIDHDGRRLTVESRGMRPRVPYFVAIPAAAGAEPDWALLHDWALIYPPRRARLVRRLGYRYAGYPAIPGRRRALEAAGALRTVRLRGGGVAGLLQVGGFLAIVEPELRDLIERFRSAYDPDRIAALGLPYA